jgi:hypothetical protein
MSLAILVDMNLSPDWVPVLVVVDERRCRVRVLPLTVADKR